MGKDRRPNKSYLFCSFIYSTATETLLRVGEEIIMHSGHSGTEWEAATWTSSDSKVPLGGAGREDGAIEEEGCGEVTEKLTFNLVLRKWERGWYLNLVLRTNRGDPRWWWSRWKLYSPRPRTKLKLQLVAVPSAIAQSHTTQSFPTQLYCAPSPPPSVGAQDEWLQMRFCVLFL